MLTRKRKLSRKAKAAAAAAVLTAAGLGVVAQATPAGANGCYAGRVQSLSRALYAGYNVRFQDFYSGSTCYFTTYSETCNPIYGRPYARVTDYTCYR